MSRLRFVLKRRRRSEIRDHTRLNMCTRLSLQGLSISSSARAIQALEIMYAPSVLAGGRHCPRPFSCGQRSRRDTCTAALHASDRWAYTHKAFDGRRRIKNSLVMKLATVRRSEGAAAYRRAVLGGIALVFGLPVQQASAGKAMPAELIMHRVKIISLMASTAD